MLYTFTPLIVFSVSGGMTRECLVFTSNWLSWWLMKEMNSIVRLYIVYNVYSHLCYSAVCQFNVFEELVLPCTEQSICPLT